MKNLYAKFVLWVIGPALDVRFGRQRPAGRTAEIITRFFEENPVRRHDLSGNG